MAEMGSDLLIWQIFNSPLDLFNPGSDPFVLMKFSFQSTQGLADHAVVDSKHFSLVFADLLNNSGNTFSWPSGEPA
jgi:hypothetical protein